MERFLLLALFGIAMAHFEGVVVVYLRKVLGIIDSEVNIESMELYEQVEALQPADDYDAILLWNTYARIIM